MAAANEIVYTIDVESITIEVISCERGGTAFFFWRVIEDKQIQFTDASLWDTANEALDKAMAHVLPDLGVTPIEEPSSDIFDNLNLLLLWDTPRGPIKTMFEAVNWYNTLVEGTAKLEAARDAAQRDFHAVLIELKAAAPEKELLLKSAALLAEIMEKQFDLAEHCNAREVMILESFIENFLGKRG